jgi:hypothetical protein
MRRLVPLSAAVALIAWNLVSAEEVFLVVLASNERPSGIAHEAHKLATAAGPLIVDVRDCGAELPMYTVTAAVSTSREEASATLSRVKSAVPDAYVKPCRVRPRSLLAYRISAVDPSMSAVPRDAVNWEEDDRLSEVTALDATHSIVAVRHYVVAKDDPLEGRRERVVLIGPAGARTTLSEQCTDMRHSSLNQRLVAFECATEEAGDTLLHSVFVVTEDGRQVKAIDHCRKPEWKGSGQLHCSVESVKADGGLVLEPRDIIIEP